MSHWKNIKKIVGMDKERTMNEEKVNPDATETAAEQEVNNAENTAAATETIDAPTTDEAALIEKLRAEKEELNDKYLRLFAEFQNYKRRTAKERIELTQTAGREVVRNLLPVLDDFDRAKRAADTDDTVEVFSEGVALVYEKLHNTLKQGGLKALDSNGETFNPDIHEAITEIPAPNEAMKGKVIDTVEKGYSLNDKIIRYAKVVVGK
jgi:molecular chaperone GrpE